MSENLKKTFKYQNELKELKAQNTDYHTWIKNWINFIRNHPERLTDSNFKEKKTIIGSIFPEKLEFDRKKFEPLFLIKHCSILLILTMVVAS